MEGFVSLCIIRYEAINVSSTLGSLTVSFTERENIFILFMLHIILPVTHVQSELHISPQDLL